METRVRRVSRAPVYPAGTLADPSMPRGGGSRVWVRGRSARVGSGCRSGRIVQGETAPLVGADGERTAVSAGYRGWAPLLTCLHSNAPVTTVRRLRLRLRYCSAVSVLSPLMCDRWLDDRLRSVSAVQRSSPPMAESVCPCTHSDRSALNRSSPFTCVHAVCRAPRISRSELARVLETPGSRRALAIGIGRGWLGAGVRSNTRARRLLGLALSCLEAATQAP